MFDVFQFFIEDLTDAFSVFGFDAGGLFHDHIGVHHDQPAVGIIGKPFVAGFGDEALDGGFVKPNIKYGFHHTRHALTGAGAYRKQEGIIGIAEFFTGEFFHPGQGFLHLVIQGFGIGFLMVVEIGAYLRGNSKARRHGQAEFGMARHLGQVSALTTQ